MPERIHTRFDTGDARPSTHAATVPKSNQDPHTRKRKRASGETTATERGSAPVTTPSKNLLGRSRITNGAADANGIHNASTKAESKSRLDHNTLAARKQALLQTRKALPIWSHQQDIRSVLRTKDILVLLGETGSGKSTQIPQFLQHEQWCTGKVAVTQPRRVAAISLARRVAEEVGTPLGSASPASRVGYSVRFDNSTSPNTKIKFLTEGMLLQEMLRDAKLSAYSAVVVDEVHERSVNVDLILGFLKNLVRTRRELKQPLKVVVMSATAEVYKLANFFDEGFDSSSLGTREILDSNSAADSDTSSESSWSGLSSSSESRRNEKSATSNVTSPNARDKTTNQAHATSAVRRTGSTLSDAPVSEPTSRAGSYVSKYVSIRAIEGRQYPVQISYLSEASSDFMDSCIKAIFQIHTKEPLPGDILVFLPGQEAIESLERQIHELSAVMDRELPRILTLPLFAALPQAAQQQIFQPAPPRTRKVILSTNIAETSVTVPGIRHVVDCGKAKKKIFHSRLGIEALLPKSISQSEAIQRKGRAGREAAGKCYRLYTENNYIALEKNLSPEILQCDLSQALLVMKARGVKDVLSFPLLDKPPLSAMTKALELLLQIGALDDEQAISENGQKIAKLPLTPSFGRVIVEAATPARDCISEVIDLLACLSVENIFINPATDEKREMAQEARQDLFRREGDHMTLLAAARAYASEQTDRREWAEKRWISHRAMQNVMNVRKQLHAQCKQLGFLPASSQLLMDGFEPVTETKAQDIIQCLLTGFLNNTAVLMPDGSYRTVKGRHIVAIHPSSVLFSRKLEAIMFTEFVFTNKAYARGVSAVQVPWISDLL